MKSGFGKYLAPLFVMVYIIAIQTASKTPFQSEIQNLNIGSSEQYVSDFSTSFYFHNSQSESTVSPGSNLPIIDFKNPNKALASNLESAIGSLQIGYSTFTYSLIDFLIHHRKACIIFPFHNFW